MGKIKQKYTIYIGKTKILRFFGSFFFKSNQTTEKTHINHGLLPIKWNLIFLVFLFLFFFNFITKYFCCFFSFFALEVNYFIYFVKKKSNKIFLLTFKNFCAAVEQHFFFWVSKIAKKAKKFFHYIIKLVHGNSC